MKQEVKELVVWLREAGYADTRGFSTDDAASLITSLSEENEGLKQDISASMKINNDVVSELEEAKKLLRIAKGYAAQLPTETIGGLGAIRAHTSDMCSFAFFLNGESK